MPGTGDDKLQVKGLPTARALICYEAIFPNERGERLDDPDSPRWLLNVTDDAWFGLTAGPYQHFAQARLRAIETGLPLARAANTGVSAVVDGRGRILAAAPLGVEAVIDSALPEPLQPTWQRRWGSWTAGAIGLLFLLAAFSAVADRKSRGRRTSPGCAQCAHRLNLTLRHSKTGEFGRRAPVRPTPDGENPQSD